MYYEPMFSSLAIWVLVGLIGAYIYTKKGRSGIIGFLGGVLLGPFGLLLALITPADRKAIEKKEKDIEREKLDRGELKKCPYCAELIRPEAVVCRYCGRDLTS